MRASDQAGSAASRGHLAVGGVSAPRGGRSRASYLSHAGFDYYRRFRVAVRLGRTVGRVMSARTLLMTHIFYQPTR